MLFPPEIPGITYAPDFLNLQQANWLLDYCLTQIAWQQESITVYDRTHPQPRLTYWMADPGVRYQYAHLTLTNHDWQPPISRLRMLISDHCQTEFNAVLLNHYRDGQDSVGWHSDDETELGSEPTIASLSVGAVRDFQIRQKPASGQSVPTLASMPLAHGSLLVMSGKFQRDYQHAIPKRQRLAQPRINLTFRWLVS